VAIVVVPSAYLFVGLLLYAVLMPIQFMLFIPNFFLSPDAATYDRRYLFSILVVFALIVSLFIIQLAISTSFPLCWPSDGFERIRMVPFLPCPK
jgi:hypothetical protein